MINKIRDTPNFCLIKLKCGPSQQINVKQNDLLFIVRKVLI